MNPIMKKRTLNRLVCGEPSWILKNDVVELAITERGGHMAPVQFFSNTATPVQPYYINPWQAEPLKAGIPVLDVLRGDFFCMPFGGVSTYRGEWHPVHGESANSMWRFESLDTVRDRKRLTLSLRVKARPGTLTKQLELVEGHSVVYCRHILEGFKGPMCLSHHATLALPEQEGGMLVSSSTIRLGQVAPREKRLNSGNEYYFLKPGSRFKSLSRISTIWKDPAYEDCSRFPLRYGFMDVAAFYAKPTEFPAWVAASVPSSRYVWFALKDARVLPQTMMWMSNGGRHAPPWNGRNRCLGLEDGCAYFGAGLEDSVRANDITKRGIPTAIQLNDKTPTVISYIQGVVRTPRGFGRVKSVSFEEDRIELHSDEGYSVKTPVRCAFLFAGEQGSPV
jgi:hypothetical protein